MPNFMKKYFSDRLPACFLLFFLLAGLTSCVDVDGKFGEEYIPHDHHMKIALDSTFRIKTYNVTVDSMVSSTLPFNLLGSYKNPYTGVSVHAGIVFEMRAPSFTASPDSLYGTNPVIDSAYITFVPWKYEGKGEQEQIFDIYELKKRISLDSTYYYDFDPEPYIHPEPIFTFSYSWKGEGESMKFRIEDPAFLARLADTTGYKVDSLFKERFKGFYVTPRNVHADAAIYNIYMSYPSRLVTYYHNENPEPDTASVSYSFAPYDWNYPLTLNQTINVVDRDYSGVYPEVALNGDTPAGRTYVESFGGIITKFEFTRESIDALKARAEAENYRDVVINKAKLQVAYPARDPELWDKLPSRLGMYTDYRKLKGIPDYDWEVEYSALLQSQNYYLPYGGYINRSLFLYEMDVTSYVQYLMRENYDTREVYLAPSYESYQTLGVDNWHNESTAVLDGSGSETPVSLVITYTMIR